MPRFKATKSHWPPAQPLDESEESRISRLAAEAEAKRVSDAIDQSLNNEREQRLKTLATTKILLLGQAESGKSTILKNFQLHFAPQAFTAEAVAWRPIVHLNLIRSINFILHFLEHKYNPRDSYSNPMSERIRHLCMRLKPLREVENSLMQRFEGTPDMDPNTPNTPRYNPSRASEIQLMSNAMWRTILQPRRQSGDLSATQIERQHEADRRILAACAEDMALLWQDDFVQVELKRSLGIRLQDQSGFFLNDIARIARLGYVPTPDDILRARLHTITPEEHHIFTETKREGAKDWIIYDVGGGRGQRAMWAQFFDDANVIIFLAALSGFNQKLAEDDKTNRLIDTLALWKQVVSNKILAKVEVILFMNKYDILDAKLNSGEVFQQYITNYSGRENKAEPVTKYLTEVFTDINRRYSPRKRRIYTHVTTAINRESTATVIECIHDSIFRKMLTSNNII